VLPDVLNLSSFDPAASAAAASLWKGLIAD
jgi:hypothetical protein